MLACEATTWAAAVRASFDSSMQPTMQRMLAASAMWAMRIELSRPPAFMTLMLKVSQASARMSLIASAGPNRASSAMMAMGLWSGRP